MLNELLRFCTSKKRRFRQYSLRCFSAGGRNVLWWLLVTPKPVCARGFFMCSCKAFPLVMGKKKTSQPAVVHRLWSAVEQFVRVELNSWKRDLFRVLKKILLLSLIIFPIWNGNLPISYAKDLTTVLECNLYLR